MVFCTLCTFFAVAAPTAECSSCTLDSPRAYWKFDELGTPLAADSSGNGFHGVAFNDAPTLSADIPSAGISGNLNSYLFDPGEGDAIQVDRPVEDDFTLCAWFKTTATGDWPDHWSMMALIHSETGNIDDDFGFGVDNSGLLAFGNGNLDEQVDTTYRSNTPVNTGDWTHGCATRNKSTGEIKIYVNGLEDGGGIGSTSTLDSNPRMQIGFGTDGATYWDGKIDEVRIYDSVLSAAEILKIKEGSFVCAETSSSSSSSSTQAGGRRGKTGNATIVRALQNKAMAPSSSSAKSVHAAATTSASMTFKDRTCARVEKWSRDSTMLMRINERLLKRFSFMCER